MKELRVVERVLLKARIGMSKHLAVFLIFLTAICGIHTQVSAQTPVDALLREPDFSNPIMTTDRYPGAKGRVEHIMNNAPFVFEGRMIKKIRGGTYYSYLFEIEKVYRGGERLQAGTIELIAIVDPNEPPLITFTNNGWYIIFAKETDYPSTVDANNSLKLEIFYHTKSNTSRFSGGEYYTSNLGLKFQTKGDLLNFLANYKLYPTDMPKADTLKTLTRREIENAKQKAISDAEEMLKRAESNKMYYRQLLEMDYQLDTLTKQPASRKDVEDAIIEYENASDSVRRVLMETKQDDYNRKVESILDAKATKKKSSKPQKRGDDDITLITSIQNIDITEDTAKYLEFDIMVRADTIGSYPYAIYLCLLYESDNLDQPFKKHI